MWNHPFYLSLYEEIMAPAPAPEVEGACVKQLKLVDPDAWRERLEVAADRADAHAASERRRRLAL